MTVNVNTGELQSGGNNVVTIASSCETDYDKVISVCGSTELLGTFKTLLINKFGVFNNHSEILSSKLAECGICLEEMDNYIAGGASGETISVDGFEFSTTGGIDTYSGDIDKTSANLKPKNNSDISHRGYRTGGTRDNSIEAFINAGENGFWGLETDVRFGTDGNLVCSHNTVGKGENPPTFEEYLDICKEYGMTAIIDLKYVNGTGKDKTGLSSEVIKTIQEKGMMDSCILQTNNMTDIPSIREASADARIWMLTDYLNEDRKNLIDEYDVECVNIHVTESLSSIRNRIDYLNDKGVDVCIWGVTTVGGKERYLEAGAKYVMSDNVLGITPYQEGEVDFNNIENS